MLKPEPTSPKSGKSRQVDAGARLCTILAGLSDERKSLAMAKGWRPVPPWAFVTRNGTPFNQRFVEEDFRRVCEKAGQIAVACVQLVVATLHADIARSNVREPDGLAATQY